MKRVVPRPQVRNALAKRSPWLRYGAMGLVVFTLAYSTAFAETLTIAHVSGLLQHAVPPPVARPCRCSARYSCAASEQRHACPPTAA